MSEDETIDVSEAVVDGDDRPPLCADMDEDCPAIEDHLHCWLYDPAKGRCPYIV